MKGKLISLTEAAIIVLKDELNPVFGTFTTVVKLAKGEPSHQKMIGVELDFLLNVPCMQFCGRSKICSRLHEKVCEESTVQIVKTLLFWELNKTIYASQSGLDTDEPGLYT
jgi:hypothetical protein